MQQLQVDVPSEFFRPTFQHEHNTNIDYIEIEKDDIMSVTDEMNANSATCPDGFPAILLENCKKGLVKPLKVLFQIYLHVLESL